MKIKWELHTSVGCKKNCRAVWLIPIDCCKKSYELICFSYHGQVEMGMWNPGKDNLSKTSKQEVNIDQYNLGICQ